jgi:hypothetical protein
MISIALVTQFRNTVKPLRVSAAIPER